MSTCTSILAGSVDFSSVSFKAVVSLLIFCLENLCIDVNGMLKFLIMCYH